MTEQVGTADDGPHHDAAAGVRRRAAGAGRDGGTAPEGGTGSTGSTGSSRIGTREAARRLGVKPATLYAYVSRGLLGSSRAPGGRGSTFDPDEVAALARRGRAGAAGTAAPGQSVPEPPSTAGSGGLGRVRTGITLIEQDRYSFRGVDAVQLAAVHGYEEAALWLWTGVLLPHTRFTAPPGPLAAARAAAAALPPASGPMDRLRVAVPAAASADPLRFDLSADAVRATARGLVAVLVDALPPAAHPVGAPSGGAAREDSARTSPPGAADITDEGKAPAAPAAGAASTGTGGDRLALRLWTRLTPAPADEAGLRVLDAALTLLIDHDLAASTLAARVAASARAHPYAVVSAGLGALDGPLHGQASALAHRALTAVAEHGGAGPVVAEVLRSGQRVPGLGHRLYRGEDPRATALFALLERDSAAAGALAAARDLAATAAARHPDLHANVDLALAVLSVAHGMPADAGEAVFAVGRTAGWIAHAMEEYGERPLRMRPVGAYDGPPPGQPLPRPEFTPR
ncbi:citrate/2-methylcitrate synthase [Actinacidiphila yeochonensis]|uniref:citrate/2-methylcitrate synthase n=1 Tax=Actinacidiphila yeochonensis TaxID=89050 RepID=UPI00099CDDE4|nr:citrate/2-methylcitrate synthase [Actinacidiphila yeochonensis]